MHPSVGHECVHYNDDVGYISSLHDKSVSGATRRG